MTAATSIVHSLYSRITVLKMFATVLSPQADFSRSRHPAAPPEHFVTFSATVGASVVNPVTLTYPQVSGCDASSMKSYYKQFGAFKEGTMSTFKIFNSFLFIY